MSNVDGTGDLLRRLEAIKQSGRTVLGQIRADAIRNAKLNARRFYKTGNLERGILKGALAPDYAIVRATANYSAYVEMGTRPHKITARPGHSLFFASQKATTERFGSGALLKFNRSGLLSAGSMRKYGNAAYVHAKSVDHPGTKAQPYLVPGAKRAVKENLGVDVIVKNWNDAA